MRVRLPATRPSFVVTVVAAETLNPSIGQYTRQYANQAVVCTSCKATEKIELIDSVAGWRVLYVISGECNASTVDGRGAAAAAFALHHQLDS